MANFGTFRVKTNPSRVFTIDYSENKLIVGDKLVEFDYRRFAGNDMCEDAEVFLQGDNWYLGWEIDEGRERNLHFIENDKLVELELVDGVWPEQFR